MKKAFIFLTDGFEEIEALGTIDILRRGGVDVESVSLTGVERVVGAHDVPVITDSLFDNAEFGKGDILILPGGTPKIDDYPNLKGLITKYVEQNKLVSAICAAPMVLGGMGLLQGRKATAYPGFESYLKGADVVEEPVVVDGKFITGRGPGFTMQFALKIVEILKGKATADEVASGLLLK